MSEDSRTEPTRGEVDAMPGAVVVEFGAGWCGICQQAQPMLSAAFARHGQVRRLRIEDGKGRPLGRSFGVKLWPTLVFLANGAEVTRLVRPSSQEELECAFAATAARLAAGR